jgi:hypothetical protein
VFGRCGSNEKALLESNVQHSNVENKKPANDASKKLAHATFKPVAGETYIRLMSSTLLAGKTVKMLIAVHPRAHVRLNVQFCFTNPMP